MSSSTNYVGQMAGLVARELPGLNASLLGLYTLLALVRGTQTTLKDVHDAWAVWRNQTGPGPQSFYPFGELPPGAQEMSRKHMDGIHRAVDEFNADLLSGRR